MILAKVDSGGARTSYLFYLHHLLKSLTQQALQDFCWVYKLEYVFPAKTNHEGDLIAPLFGITNLHFEVCAINQPKLSMFSYVDPINVLSIPNQWIH